MGSTIGSIFGSGAQGESESYSNNNFKNDPVNSYTPFGSVTYKQNKDGSWQQDVNLAWPQQSMLNQQNTFGQQSGEFATNWWRLNNALEQYGKGLDTSGLYNLSARGGVPLGDRLAQAMGYKTSGYDDGVYNKAYNTLLTNYTQGMQAARDRDIANQQQDLANQGIRVGSEAFRRATNDLNDKWYQNLSNAQQQAAADAYRYAQQDVELANATKTQALQNAIAANNQQLQEQMTINPYLYNMLAQLMGNTSVVMPQGYSGAALSGVGSGMSQGESGSSSGGLLNSIGAWF